MSIDNNDRNYDPSAGAAAKGVSASTLDMVGRLALKRGKVSKHVRRAWLAVAASAALTVVLSLVAWLTGPQHVGISSVDIPDAVLGAFSAGGGYSSPLANAASNLSSILPYIGVFAFMVSLIAAVVIRSMGPLIIGIFAAAMPGMASFVFSAAAETSGPSPRDAFVEMVSDLDYLKAKGELAFKELADKPAGAYVLAQIGVSAGPEKNEDSQNELQAKALLASDKQDGFAPSPKTLYALDSALFGKPQSQASSQYLKERKQMNKRWVIVATAAATISGILALLSLGAWLLLRLLSARLTRLHGLMQPHKSKAQKIKVGRIGSYS